MKLYIKYYWDQYLAFTANYAISEHPISSIIDCSCCCNSIAVSSAKKNLRLKKLSLGWQSFEPFRSIDSFVVVAITDCGIVPQSILKSLSNFYCVLHGSIISDRIFRHFNALTANCEISLWSHSFPSTSRFLVSFLKIAGKRFLGRVI